jgi:hypothetical protein
MLQNETLVTILSDNYGGNGSKASTSRPRAAHNQVPPQNESTVPVDNVDCFVRHRDVRRHELIANPHVVSGPPTSMIVHHTPGNDTPNPRGQQRLCPPPCRRSTERGRSGAGGSAAGPIGPAAAPQGPRDFW